MIQIEINEDLKKKFEDDGYLILPQFLDTKKIASIADKFTNLSEIKNYFGMNYYEWGEVQSAEMGGGKRTYFAGRYGKI